MQKAYIDGSYKDDSGGIGYIVYKNDIPISKCRKKVNERDSNQLEYIALRELLNHINELNIKNIIIYTDSKNITNQLANIGTGKEIKNDIFKEIIYLLKLNPTTKVKWIPRKRNLAAHNLCRQVTYGLDDLINYETAIQIKAQKQKHEIKMVVKHRTHMILQCPVCREHKPATEFPRFREGHQRRKCNTCEGKLNQLNFSYLKTKNTY